jgi:hypothetical protein
MENVETERERERIQGKKKDGLCTFSKFSEESQTNPNFQKHCGSEEEE